MTRLTWMARATSIPILATLTSLDRIPIVGSLTVLTLLGRLTRLTGSITTARPTGKDRQEDLYRLTVMDPHNRLTRMVRPTSRHRFIRG